MVETGNLYVCEHCKNVISAVDGKGVPVMCCGQEMTELNEKTVEQEGKEKHVPIVKIDGNNVKVTVGSVEHPMEEGHYIQMIEVLSAEGQVLAQARLYPGKKPYAEFVLENVEGIYVREYCNLHGLWRS